MKNIESLTWLEGLSPYKRDLFDLMVQLGEGGWMNAHAHLDRADTNKVEYWEDFGVDPEEASGFSLRVKQNLTGELHRSPAYKPDDLRKRIGKMIEKAILFETKRIVSFIDVSAEINLSAVRAAIDVQQEFSGQIDFQIGIQPIFGFKNYRSPERWEIYSRAVELEEVSVLGGLPEVDDKPERIGFEEHCQLIIEKAIELGKEVHIHVDQKNSPLENGTERVLDVVEAINRKIRCKTLGKKGIVDISKKRGRPFIWLIHMISPSCYGDDRFKLLVNRIKKFDLGVICCPRAAISMLQLRPIETHIHNSIARVLDLIKNEIPVEIGTDNVADVFIPTGDINMLEEVALLPDPIRYSVKKTWVKIACGIPLNNMDLELIGRSLYQDNKTLDRYK